MSPAITQARAPPTPPCCHTSRRSTRGKLRAINADQEIGVVWSTVKGIIERDSGNTPAPAKPLA